MIMALHKTTKSMPSRTQFQSPRSMSFGTTDNDQTTTCKSMPRRTQFQSSRSMSFDTTDVDQTTKSMPRQTQFTSSPSMSSEIMPILHEDKVTLPVPTGQGDVQFSQSFKRIMDEDQSLQRPNMHRQGTLKYVLRKHLGRKLTPEENNELIKVRRQKLINKKVTGSIVTTGKNRIKYWLRWNNKKPDNIWIPPSEIERVLGDKTKLGATVSCTIRYMGPDTATCWAQHPHTDKITLEKIPWTSDVFSSSPKTSPLTKSWRPVKDKKNTRTWRNTHKAQSLNSRKPSSATCTSRSNSSMYRRHDRPVQSVPCGRFARMGSRFFGPAQSL